MQDNFGQYRTKQDNTAQCNAGQHWQGRIIQDNIGQCRMMEEYTGQCRTMLGVHNVGQFRVVRSSGAMQCTVFLKSLCLSDNRVDFDNTVGFSQHK